ncbi:MAG: glycosyltransferase, partial [Lachnospiraceae bacterium]|nr:glycosyltransferase [Lachnospiraceae bacterium]
METEQILFSIVVPVYNVEQYLEDCITSITGQIDDTLKNCVEILLIDDGSTDQSGRLCDRFKERYPFLIRVVHKENEGLLATRRRG